MWSKPRRFTMVAALFIVMTVGHAAVSTAAEIRLLSSNGIRAVLEELLPQFERTTKHTVAATYSVAAGLRRQIDAGEPFDVAILTPAQLDDLIKTGKIVADTRLVLARSPMAIAMRAGARKSDIRTTDALVRTLLDSMSIAYAREGAGGVFLTQLMKRLELTERLTPKLAPTTTGADVTAAVARGDAQLGILPLSEILPVKGIEVLGTFPPDLQDYVVMVGGVSSGSRQRAAASELLKYLQAAAVPSVLEKKGMQPAQSSAPRRITPAFEVDAAWPKIPNNWQFGWVASVAVDAQDHVWVLQRPGSLSAAEKPRAAPPVLEFDGNGAFIQAWGGPGAGYEWPESEHGIFVDANGFVWIGGNGPKDHQLLKFTRAGKFVMQIGHAGQSKGNADTQNLNRPADVFVYAKTNELIVADGYGNRRVIVFDADTGRFKRMWGAFGKAPSDAPPDPADADAGETGAPQFVQPVHAARVANDGLVYVSDRGGKRVQIFSLDGRFLSQVFIGRDCRAPACGNGQTAAATAFSGDAEQRFVYVGDAGHGTIAILDRKTLAVLDSFGRRGSAPGEFGTLHHLASDSKGNVYVTEVAPLKPENRRVQKFRLVGTP